MTDEQPWMEPIRKVELRLRKQFAIVLGVIIAVAAFIDHRQREQDREEIRGLIDLTTSVNSLRVEVRTMSARQDSLLTAPTRR